MKDSQLIAHFDKVTKDYSGDISKLEHAIGAYLVGRQFGWKIMLLVHDRKTIAKYEDILGLDFRELPDVGEYAHKSWAWQAMDKVSNFWKAVRGEIPGIRSPMFD